MKSRALVRAAAAQRLLDRYEDKATEHAKARDERVAEAQAAGATYAEIQSATDLSTSRITQILRRARG